MMSYIVKDRHLKIAKPSAGECHPYWVIDSASGPTSRGICKRCGAQREFFNSLYAIIANREALLKLPELSNVEVGVERNGS